MYIFEISFDETVSVAERGQLVLDIQDCGHSSNQQYEYSQTSVIPERRIKYIDVFWDSKKENFLNFMARHPSGCIVKDITALPHVEYVRHRR